MLKIKSFCFALLSISGVGLLGIFLALYIFSGNFDTVTGGEATEIFFIWPDDLMLLNDEEKQQSMEPILQTLENWAKENHSTILLKPKDAIGVAIADYSGWMKENYGIEYSCDKNKTAIIEKKSLLEKLYVKNDILFPEDYDYHVIGTYSAKQQKDEDYANHLFYSFSDYRSVSNDIAGLLHIYAFEDAKLNVLIDQMQKMGVTINNIHHSGDLSGETQGYLQILLENDTVRFMMISFIGVILCTALSLFLFYRSAIKELAIRHLYGATYGNLFRTIGFSYIAAALTGIAFGFLLGKNLLEIFDFEGALKIGVIMGIAILFVTFLLHVISYFTWYLHCHKEGGGC